MDQKNITLELLVRSGNPKGVKQFAESERFDEAKKTEKVTEAGVYSAINSMWEEAGGGIDSESICNFFLMQEFTNYFSTVNNTEVLEKIVDVLKAGTEAMMEAYAQITAIDILGIKSVADAIKRNIDAPNMKDKVKELVRRGYSLVFCPYDIDAEMVEHYFSIIDKWREFVNPQEVAKQAISNFEEKGDLFENHYQKRFVYKALDKLIELTDRETVSRLVYEYFGESEEYQIFIDDGKVDAYALTAKPEESVNTNLDRALQKYEEEIFPSTWSVNELSEAVGEKDKEYIAQKMGIWFKEGRMRNLLKVAEYEEGRLYDHNIARRVVSEGIAEALNGEDLNRLIWVLDLPKHLIDEKNDAIMSVVTAYNISQQTKGKE